MPQKRKTVYLGMSGGVDSSVSAALLAKAGYQVVGVFIKVWEPENVPCTWRAERRDAMRVAACLNIPLVTLDLSTEYKKGVIDYMVAEYKAGRTPNPDVQCNRQIKFGAFYDWARRQGADFVATGHYAQVKDNQLMKSEDRAKDQTYFLWNLRAEQLAHILFPIGHLTKPAVRKLAKQFKLPTAEKRDSQGLCFVGQVDFKEFLSRQLGPKPGKLLNERGEVVGQHHGAPLYTIGERHGFTLHHQTVNTKPSFVIARDVKLNTVTVSQDRSRDTSSVINLEQVNWINGMPELTAKNSNLKARIRHRGELFPCQIKVSQNQVAVKFLAPPEAPATGQSLVFYAGENCLGGGVMV